MHRYANSPLLSLIERYGRIRRNRQEIGLALAVFARAVKQINIFGIRFHRLADCLPVLCRFARFRRRKPLLSRIGNGLPAQCRIARLPFLPHAAFYPALLVYIEQHDQLAARRAVSAACTLYAERADKTKIEKYFIITITLHFLYPNMTKTADNVMQSAYLCAATLKKRGANSKTMQKRRMTNSSDVMLQ